MCGLVCLRARRPAERKQCLHTVDWQRKEDVTNHSTACKYCEERRGGEGGRGERREGEGEERRGEKKEWAGRGGQETQGEGMRGEGRGDLKPGCGVCILEV